jgi:hypothetical protein
MAEVFEIHFVVDDGAPSILPERWTNGVKMLILEFQPAISAHLEGDPPRAIRIESYGGVEVARGLLAQVERRLGTSLHVEGGVLEPLPGDGATSSPEDMDAETERKAAG